MKLYLAAGPEDAGRAAASGCPVAVLGGRLCRGSLQLRDGICGMGALLALDAREPGAFGPVQPLAGALWSTARELGYQGLVLDGGDRPGRELGSLARALAGRKQGEVYVTASAAPGGVCALVETALSGGTLRGHLMQAVQRHGAACVALDIARSRMEFPLPAKNGQGKCLTPEMLTALLQQPRSPVRFSPELCAQYFTRKVGREMRFVLYDDGASIRKKLQLAASMGIGTAFLFWPEVRDLPELLRRDGEFSGCSARSSTGGP